MLTHDPPSPLAIMNFHVHSYSCEFFNRDRSFIKRSTYQAGTGSVRGAGAASYVGAGAAQVVEAGAAGAGAAQAVEAGAAGAVVDTEEENSFNEHRGHLQ